MSVKKSGVEEQLLRDLEPPFLLDYMTFGCHLQQFIVGAVEPLTKHPDMIDDARRLAALTVFREEMNLWENLGALLFALKARFSSRAPTLLEGLVRYRPGDAVIQTQVAGMTAAEALVVFGLQELVAIPHQGFLATLDLNNLVKNMAELIIDAYKKSQTEKRLQAYNKLKHGTIWVSSGRLFRSSMPDTPAAIFRRNDPTPTEPYALFGLKQYHDIEPHLVAISDGTNTITTIVGLYLLRFFAGFLAAKGRTSPEQLFTPGTQTFIYEVSKSQLPPT